MPHLGEDISMTHSGVQIYLTLNTPLIPPNPHVAMSKSRAEPLPLFKPCPETPNHHHTSKPSKIMSPSTRRWCPTPEQLMILEELYSRGLKTPNASQIQKITTHLSSYGKIQGKNVFYWFQNHKARDRQKLRKKLAKQHQILQHHLHQQYPIDPITRFGNHILHFQTPLPFLLSSNSYSQENLHAQGASGVCEEAPEGMQSQTWRPDLPKDYLHDVSSTIYGYDSMMINMDAGPTFPYCTSCSRTKPLQTLELFPLTATHQETTS